MNTTALHLIVIKVRDLIQAKAFYEALGLSLVEEQHGSGPVHYSWSQNGLVFELYPAVEGKSLASVRFGFAVEDVDATVIALQQAGGRVISAARNSQWGRRAVLSDPEGHTVEIVEQKSI